VIISEKKKSQIATSAELYYQEYRQKRKVYKQRKFQFEKKIIESISANCSGQLISTNIFFLLHEVIQQLGSVV